MLELKYVSAELVELIWKLIYNTSIPTYIQFQCHLLYFQIGGHYEKTGKIF